MDIVYYPDPQLREKSHPLEEYNQELADLARAMLDFMYDSRGVGLAGPQVGLNSRIFVMNPTGDRNQPEAERVVINPEVRSRRGASTGEEGCLSLPDIYAEVTRPDRIEVAYRDPSGKEVELDLEGFQARVFQHELDHLEGILFIDRIEPAEKILVRKKLKKLEERFARNRATH